MKIRVAILRNESSIDHEEWIKACQRRQDEIDYSILDITSSDWLIQFKSKPYDLILLRPPGRTEKFKKLYDERSYILCNYSGIPVYPSLNEVLVYENKRFLRDWLTVNDIPLPETNVFYFKNAALDYVESNKFYPIVAKTNIGASGDGVRFLQSQKEVTAYIYYAFKNGIKSRTGPKLHKGSILHKIVKAVSSKEFITRRLSEYSETFTNPQKGFVIFQKFVPHEYEWRCVRIGDSFFAHKKIARKNKSSGTLIKGYDPVPITLLEFILEITDRTKLYSVAIDLFESDNQFMVNEIQCFFGQSDPYQMLVDSKPGRYRKLNEEWVFEEGDFASNQCYDLRLSHAISLLAK
jgi:glutathione synthase/RimK-type ligase-like ATP-grasp enzyme